MSLKKFSPFIAITTGLGIHCISRNHITSPNTFIDVKETNFCQYLSPSKTNYIFFDYYEYYVDWKINSKPPVYKYWNFSITPVLFYTDKDSMSDEKFNVSNPHFIKGPVF